MRRGHYDRWPYNCNGNSTTRWYNPNSGKAEPGSCHGYGTIRGEDGKMYCKYHVEQGSEGVRTMYNKKAAEIQVERASSALDRALDALEKAEALEALMPQEPQYEEGNTAVVFRKQFHAGGIYYTYCAVGIQQTGIFDTQAYVRSNYKDKSQTRLVWYVSGSKTWQEKKVVWADLMEWLMAGEKWEVWQVSEFNLLGSSE